MADNSTCLGCNLNPNFYLNPWFPSDVKLPDLKLNFFPRLDEQERELLRKLGESYSLFCLLDKRSESDNKEFLDAIHRLQQLVALRVARRADPDVWA